MQEKRSAETRSLSGGAGDDGVISADSRLARYLEGLPLHGHTTDRVTQILREAILDGVLAPSTWLRETELAKELSVSRTPVREALRRLSVEGLVTITAHQGAMVARMINRARVVSYSLVIVPAAGKMREETGASTKALSPRQSS